LSLLTINDKIQEHNSKARSHYIINMHYLLIEKKHNKNNISMRIVYTGTSCCTGITIIPSNLSYVQRNSEIWSIHANPREAKSGECEFCRTDFSINHGGHSDVTKHVGIANPFFHGFITLYLKFWLHRF
jgi:hypothetical protein